MRWVTATLAAATAATQLVLFALTEQQVRTIDLPTATSGPGWLRVVWALAWTAPWLVGAVLLAVRRAELGTVVLLTSSALLVAMGLGGITPALTWPPFEALGDVGEAIQRFGGLAVWLLAVATGLTAWAGRPRRSGAAAGWRAGAPGPGAWYVTFAILAWLPSVLRTTAFAPPGAPRHFVETHLGGLHGLVAASHWLTPLVLAALLWVAPRLRRDLAGVLLLTLTVPPILSDVGDLVDVATQEFLILTPAGVLGPIGMVGLAIIGIVWLVRGPVGGRVSGPVGDDPVSDGPVSDAATGRARHRELASPRSERDPG